MPSYKGRMRSMYLEKGMRMSFLETMLARAKADKQTIVLPEGNDPRTLEAAEKLIAHDACNVIVLGREEELKAGDASFAESASSTPKRPICARSSLCASMNCANTRE